MNSNKTSKQAQRIARRAALRAARALNAPTYRGFRNKGKVVAGMEPAKTPRLRGTRKTTRYSRKVFSAPAAVGGVVRATAVRRRVVMPIDEYIADITTPSGVSAFATLLSGPVNPGNANLFPKLSAACDTSEKYRFLNLRIEAVPDSSTATSGAVYMNFDYDPVDAAPINATQVMQNSDAVAFAPWLSASIDLDVRQNAQKWYYIQNSLTNSAAAADRQQDQAVFNMFVDRIAANTLIGQLKITGLVELMGSRPLQSLAFSGSFANGGVYPTVNLSTLPGVPVNLPVYTGGTTAYYDCATVPIVPLLSSGVTRGTRLIGDATPATFTDSSSLWNAVTLAPGSYSCNVVVPGAYGNAVSFCFALIAVSSTNTGTVLAPLTAFQGTGGTSSQVISGSAVFTVTNTTQVALTLWSLTAGQGVTINTGLAAPLFIISPQGYTSNVGAVAALRGTSSFQLPGQLEVAQAYLAQLSACTVSIADFPQVADEKCDLDALLSRIKRLELDAVERPLLIEEIPSPRSVRSNSRSGASRPPRSAREEKHVQ